MAVTYSADEVFEIAEQIERNGQKFYRRAAEIVEEGKLQQLLLELADWEINHEKLFAEMRQDLEGKEKAELVYDPDEQGVLYLRAMADGQVFNLRADLSEQLEGKESVGDILKMALEMEKNAVLFYSGIRTAVPAEYGREKVEAILNEEMRHITIISAQFDAVAG